MKAEIYHVPRYKKRSLWVEVPLLIILLIAAVLMCAGNGLMYLINKVR